MARTLTPAAATRERNARKGRADRPPPALSSAADMPSIAGEGLADARQGSSLAAIVRAAARQALASVRDPSVVFVFTAGGNPERATPDATLVAAREAQALCPRCRNPVGVRFSAPGRLTAQCARCNDREAFSAPDVVMQRFPALRAVVSRDFELIPAPAVAASGVAALVAEGARSGRLLLLESPDSPPLWLVPRPGAFAGVRALDGAWLEHTLAGSSAVVDYQHGVAEVLDVLRADPAASAILIRPASLQQIERTAREGLLMPPKSTFFTPKLRTGMVLRPLDGA